MLAWYVKQKIAIVPVVNVRHIFAWHIKQNNTKPYVPTYVFIAWYIKQTMFNLLRKSLNPTYTISCLIYQAKYLIIFNTSTYVVFCLMYQAKYTIYICLMYQAKYYRLPMYTIFCLIDQAKYLTIFNISTYVILLLDISRKIFDD